MSDDSVQKKLAKTRTPRVQITYDVEIGDAIKSKELPFVVGVMADLSGNPKEELPRLKERKFVNIDGDNFDEVLKGQKPRVACRVDNKLQSDGSQISVDIEFEKFTDFEPDSVVQQVKPLKELLEIRNKLSDLKNKVMSNDKLEELLQDVLHNMDDLEKIQSETKIDEGHDE